MRVRGSREHHAPQKTPRNKRGTSGIGGTGGWIHTAKLAFFVALGFVRFVGESTPVQPPVSRQTAPGRCP